MVAFALNQCTRPRKGTILKTRSAPRGLGPMKTAARALAALMFMFPAFAEAGQYTLRCDASASIVSSPKNGGQQRTSGELLTTDIFEFIGNGQARATFGNALPYILNVIVSDTTYDFQPKTPFEGLWRTNINRMTGFYITSRGFDMGDSTTYVFETGTCYEIADGPKL